MDPVLIAIAFLFGFIANQVKLPPLVGYLVAGFVLNAFGIHGGDNLQTVAELGVTLLLFSIGLKLQLRSLFKPEVWAGASIHMLITIAVFGVGIYGLGSAGLSLFSSLDFKLALLIAFALSFSSTVFAVKVLEERGEMASLHGRVAIGILIMQDIFAVLFITASTGKMPSPWAIALIASLFVIRPLLFKIMDRCGHRELLILFGLFLALGLGAGGFEAVGLKADLGALVIGLLVSSHPKANELSKSLLSFKDLFLVGFFLSIGMEGIPTLETFGIASLLTVVVIFKVALFFMLLPRFRLRAWTSFMAALSLANYSEFGLLVATIGVRNGWIGSEWLVVIAIALSMTFIIASPLNATAHSLYARYDKWLKPFELTKRHPDDQPIDPGDAEYLIFGMGRIGTGAYITMRDRYGSTVLGLDYDREAVRAHQEAGRNVIRDDATDPDFWNKINPGKVRMVMLAMRDHSSNLYAIQRLKEIQFGGIITAIAQFDDEVEALKQAGADAAFNFYSEAGTGFADHVCNITGSCGIKR
jgi:predicted Kef-type K+ transport protein